MKGKHWSGWLILLVPVLLMTTCQKERFDLDRLSGEIELEPRLVAPIVYGQVSMKDITAIFDSADYVGEFDNGLIYVAYTDTLVSVSADTAIEIPAIETAEYYVDSDADFDFNLPVPVGDTAFIDTRVKIVDYNLEGDNRLDEVLVKNGIIALDLQSSFRHRGSLTISSDEIFDPQGRPFSRVIEIDRDDGSFMVHQEFPADSFTIIPTVINDSSFIFMDFDLALVNSGAPIAPGEQCVIQATFTEMNFYRVYGFIDTKQLVDAQDTLDIPLWRDNPDLAAIKFADPRIDITTSSSVGVPFEIDLDSLIAMGIDGTEVPLTLNEGNTLSFLAPGMDQQGETVTTTIEINNTTSNIDEFVNSAPASILYNVEGRTATTGDDTTHFVLDDSRLDLSVSLLVPLDLKSTGYAFTDTLDFTLGDGGVDTSRVRNAELTLYTRNELPVELLVQLYFMDANDLVIDSVFDDRLPLLGASEVDPASGLLVAATEETNTIEFPAEKLARLEEAAYIRFNARLTTSSDGNPYVKILSHYTLGFKVSVLADVRINTQLQ